MKVAIVGTGYVGLVTGTCLASRGHRVACVDCEAHRVATLARGAPPFPGPGLAGLLGSALHDGRLSVGAALEEAVADSDVSMLAVGTPSREGRIDLSAVEAAATAVGRALGRREEYHVVVVKSTVVAGTTDTVVRRSLEAGSGRPAGAFGLCMNPEFLREGSAVADFMRPDRIVVGCWDARSAAVLDELYRGFDCPRIVTSLRNAEMIKYAANALLATLVSYSNQVTALCEALTRLADEAGMTGGHLDPRLTPPDGGGGPAGVVA